MCVFARDYTSSIDLEKHVAGAHETMARCCTAGLDRSHLSQKRREGKNVERSETRKLRVVTARVYIDESSSKQTPKHQEPVKAPQYLMYLHSTDRRA